MEFRFLEDLDRDLKSALIAQIRDLWTHTSTAIEGNSLSLGDTHFILTEGLTVSGKPLKDHEEVVGHARAIELLYALINQATPLEEELIFSLHKSVQTELYHDIYKPVGAWKREINGTYTLKNEEQIYIEYPHPEKIPELMESWFKLANSLISARLSRAEAIKAYGQIHNSFVKIHPFADGNGRMARLLGNIPLLRNGEFPLIISQERRREYIEILSNFQLVPGNESLELLLEGPEQERFVEFLHENDSAVANLVQQAREIQAKR